MKLGIVVVYILEEHLGGLLELHLARIARHTSMPWTIYGSTNRLLPRFRDLLRGREAIRLFELAPTDKRGTPEHSWYLEQLIAAAFEDGATHVVTLHVDSFPIADGWDQRLRHSVSEGAAFVTLDHINTACLFVPREFYLTHHPTLLVPGAQQSGPVWESYLREYDPIPHSGIGYGLAVHRAGLRWHSIPPSTAERTGAPVVFGDLLLHVGGAVRLAGQSGRSSPLLRRIGFRRTHALTLAGRQLIRAARSVTPRPLRQLLRPLVPRVEASIAAPQKKLHSDLMAVEIERLLADPDGYVASLPRG